MYDNILFEDANTMCVVGGRGGPVSPILGFIFHMDVRVTHNNAKYTWTKFKSKNLRNRFTWTVSQVLYQ